MSGLPAACASVGSQSSPEKMPFSIVPGLILPGQRMMQGKRKPPQSATFTAFKSWIAWERSLRFKYMAAAVKCKRSAEHHVCTLRPKIEWRNFRLARC
jgi:hypothetical protein